MNFTKLVETVSKKQVSADATFFIVEVMASDDEGEDVEVRRSFPRLSAFRRADTRYRSFRSLSSVASNFET